MKLCMRLIVRYVWETSSLSLGCRCRSVDWPLLMFKLLSPLSVPSAQSRSGLCSAGPSVQSIRFLWPKQFTVNNSHYYLHLLFLFTENIHVCLIKDCDRRLLFLSISAWFGPFHYESYLFIAIYDNNLF